MGNKIAFHWYAGAGLARQLQYRKKGLFSNSLVCEWAAVFSMAKSGFLLGCALPLTSQEAAETTLKDAANTEEWKVALNDVVENMHTRVKSYIIVRSFINHQMLFPETFKLINPNQLMSPEDCGTSIGQRIILGLVFGILYPELAFSLLKNEIEVVDVYRRISVGGLSVNDKPQFTSVEQAKSASMDIYNGWLELQKT